MTPDRRPGKGRGDYWTLVVVLDDAGLALLGRERARIALARGSGRARPNAVWLAWAPQPVTTICWTAPYGVYAAAVSERNGAAIRLLASAPALERAVHPFLGDGFASPIGCEALPRRHYGIRNDSPYTHAFGLLQSATIGETALDPPLNAVVLPPGFSADFTDFDMLYLWARAGVWGTTVTAEIEPPVTAFAHTSGERTMRYRYDAQTRLFAPSPGPADTGRFSPPHPHEPA